LIEKSRFISQLKENNKELEEASIIKNEFLSRLKSEVSRQTEYLKTKNIQYEILLKIASLSSIHFKVSEILGKSFYLLKEYFNLESITFIRKSFRKNKLKVSYIENENTEVEYFDIFDTTFKSKYRENFLNEEILDSNTLNKNFDDIEYLKNKKLNYFIYIPIVFKEQFLGAVVLAKKYHIVFNKKEFKFIDELKEVLKISMHHLIQVNKANHDKEKLLVTSSYLASEIKVNFGEIIGESKKLKKVLEQIKKVAPTQSTVLIRGETGSGKELIARAIHNNSLRKNNIFVKVNCAALTDSIITSELFGHEKGAFTGAFEKKIGKFELANGGTLFLDEIGEIPLDFQVKLLRVLQERELERVGGNKTIRVDIRLIVATNKDLEDEINKKQFRADLFYRLNVFPIFIPSLTERKIDIIPLTRHFIQKYNKVMNKSVSKISEKTESFLLKYHFPGNIRELENMIERGVILSENDTLHLESSHYGVVIEERKSHATFQNDKEIISLDEVIEKHLRYVMDKSRWKVYGENGAAKMLGMKPTTLQSKLKKFKIK